MTNKVKNLMDFFEKNPDYIPYCGVYDCRNTAGDPMYRIYSNNDDGVVVDYCGEYSYVEIFGLDKDEFTEIANKLHERKGIWE